MTIDERAARDVKRISTNPAGGGTSVTFTTPDDRVSKTVWAMTTKHSTRIDELGIKSIGSNATVVVSEAALVAAGYMVRVNDEISLLQHKVSWTDVSGINWTYTIRTTRPDDKVGFITCTLDGYET